MVRGSNPNSPSTGGGYVIAAGLVSACAFQKDRIIARVISFIQLRRSTCNFVRTREVN